MRLYALSTKMSDMGILQKEYKSARQVGVVRIGESCLYIKRGWKVYYIPYADIRRCFRRVMLVPAKLCCGKGEIPVENLVICTSEGEAAQVQLPGTKAAKALMEALKEKLPEAEFTPPAQKEQSGEAE